MLETPLILIFVYFVYALLWQGYELRRRVGRRSQLTLIATVVVVNSIPLLFDVIRAGLLGEDAILYRDIALRVLIFLTCILFFLFCRTVAYEGLVADRRDVLPLDRDRGRDLDRRILRARRTIQVALVGAVVLLVGIVWLGVSAVNDGVPTSYRVASFGDVRVGLMQAVPGAVGGVLVLWSLGWMLRAAYRSWTQSRASAQLRLLVGVLIAAIGIVATGTTTIVRAVPPTLVLLGLPSFEINPQIFSALQVLGNPFALLGLSFPLFTSRLVGWRNRRVLRRIDLLWRATTSIFRNHLEVDTTGMSRHERLAWTLQRHRDECVDGLRTLALPQAADRLGNDQRELAEAVRTAIELHDARHPDRQAALIAHLPDSVEAEAEVDLTAAPISDLVRVVFTGVDSATAREDRILGDLAAVLRDLEVDPDPVPTTASSVR